YTWAEVDERARRLATALLSTGLAKGDRVLVIARNCVEWLEIIYGLASAGLVAVPVNIRLAADELAHIRDDSGAVAAIVHSDQAERFGQELSDLSLVLTIEGSAPGREYEEALRRGATAESAAVELSADDSLFILYTSGTTGRSKGVVG